MSKAVHLSAQGQALLDLLVAAIHGGAVHRERPQTFPSYGDMLGRLKLSPDAPRGHTEGETLQLNGLNDLANWILPQRNMPRITGLIVSRNSYVENGYRRPANVPGTGYFKEYSRKLEDWEWWMKQIDASFRFDWLPHISPEVSFTAAEIVGVEVVTEGKMTIKSQKVRERSARLRELAREHFRDEMTGKLHCAICTWTAPDLELSGPIVELHHLDELRLAPAKGKAFSINEALAQLIPLCPNCHRVLHAKVGGGCLKIQQLRDIQTKTKQVVAVPREMR